MGMGKNCHEDSQKNITTTDEIKKLQIETWMELVIHT